MIQRVCYSMLMKPSEIIEKFKLTAVNKPKKLSCIYMIYNKESDKAYIGQTKNARNRKSAHFRDLQSNKACNSYLQKSWNLHGLGAFSFYILEICEAKEEILNQQEEYWVGKISEENCYNLNKVGDVSRNLEKRIESLKKSYESEERRMKCSVKKRLLSEEQANFIREKFLRGIDKPIIARKLNLPINAVKNIVNGKCYTIGPNINKQLAIACKNKEIIEVKPSKDEILEARKRGISNENICYDFNCSLKTVREAQIIEPCKNIYIEGKRTLAEEHKQKIKNSWYEDRKNSKRFKLLTEEEMEKFKILNEEGWPLAKIAKYHNLQPTRISTIFKNHGWETIRHYDKFSKEETLKIKELLKMEVPITKIAKKFNCNRDRIYKVKEMS